MKQKYKFYNISFDYSIKFNVLELLVGCTARD